MKIVEELREWLGTKLTPVPVRVDDAEPEDKNEHVFLKLVDTDFSNTLDLDETNALDVDDSVATEVDCFCRAPTSILASALAYDLAKRLDKLKGGIGSRYVDACEIRDFRSDPNEAKMGLSRGRSVIVVPVVVFNRPNV